MNTIIRTLAVSLFLGAVPPAALADRFPAVGVGPQYDTTHVYVAPRDVDRFVASFLATFGGKSTKQVVAQVTPTPSRTSSQLLQTPVGTVSLFGFRSPIPYPFGEERTGYLVTDLDAAIKSARSAGADVLVAPFPDPIGRDAVIQWPGGVDMQLYWHTTKPAYAPLEKIPENRVYVSPDRADAFVRGFLSFSRGRVVSDDRRAPEAELGLSEKTYRRVRIESAFGKMCVSVTDGHLPFPFGRETTGYEVANLSETLVRAKDAGVSQLTEVQVVDGCEEAMVEFPGGYIAEIHSQAAKPSQTMFAPCSYRKEEKGPITHADLERWASAWSSHSVDSAIALFSKDVVINQPANPKPLDYAGAKKFFGMIFRAYPDFHVELVKPIVDGYDAVSVERVTGTWIGTYTDPSTGKSVKGNGRHFDHPGAMVIHYRPDHKIDRVSIYWDQLTVDRQLGVKPAL